MIGCLIDADKVVVKTVEEALGVPRAEVNAEAVDTVRYLSKTFSGQGQLFSNEINLEAGLIESEARTVLSAIFGLPGNAFWESVYRAFQHGWIDVPFCPHADNANRLVTMRDGNQSIRVVDPGFMPISASDLDTERRLLGTRGSGADQKAYLQMLADIALMA